MKVLNQSVNQHPDFDAGKEVSTMEIMNSVVVFDEMLEKKANRHFSFLDLP